MSIETKLFGVDLFGDAIIPETKSPVAREFIVPPFSVLSARDGGWQARKRAWIAIGIKSEEGRGAETYNTGGPGTIRAEYENKDRLLLAKSSGTDFYSQKRKEEEALGRSLETKEFQEKYYEPSSAVDSGTSIFDPVVCELIYTWFSRRGHQVVDPFAGGSVRGVVASHLRRRYWGGELRSEQVEANRKQVAEICSDTLPEYVCGDSMQTVASAPEADLLFSCPPYGDLEIYSDDPDDLSNMEYHTFVAAYKTIILRACKRLKPNRFACFVVGDFRDKKGFYRNFVSETIAAFEYAGCRLYNEAILVTSVGSASMRVTRQFNGGRKFCKTHQNVLVFCKGDWKAAVEELTTV